MDRVYYHILSNHYKSENKMVFIVGPRQVGKTTCSKAVLSDAVYLTWDNLEHRSIILQKPSQIAEITGVNSAREKAPSVIFDELHKFSNWKNFLKGFFDTYGDRIRICVTGSGRLDIFRHGGDSLMGRYFLYHMHPVSVREAVSPEPGQVVNGPVPVPDEIFNRLWTFGGYPEPYMRSDTRFFNRWKRLRMDSLFEEDLRDLTRVTDMGRMRVFAQRLVQTIGGALNYSHLATDLQVSVDTVRRWLDILESVYYCFRIRPHSRNVAHSLLREPKAYLWDWSLVPEGPARAENMVAAHLHKWCHYLTDTGIGTFDLSYLRDKQGREVDFIVLRDGQPFALFEVKSGDAALSKPLVYFKGKTGAPHAFQISMNAPFENVDCFSTGRPVKVPARTLLSQLV
jgi:predicted AAA+ superfamily ATPase